MPDYDYLDAIIQQRKAKAERDSLSWWKVPLLLLAIIPIGALLYVLAVLAGAPFLHR